MDRRLPLYLVLDVSGSMGGTPIQSVNNGLQTVQTALRRNSQACETVCVSVITFGAETKLISPLTEVLNFVPPVLTAGGGTPFGAALKLVKNLAEKEVQKNTYEQKGDWKPIVFIMIAGEPTDDYKSGIAEFKTYKWGPVIACAAGSGADVTVLKEVTETVLSLDTLDSSTIESLFKWQSFPVSPVPRIDKVSSDAGASSLLPPPSKFNFIIPFDERRKSWSKEALACWGQAKESF